ncbi:MAG: hypothetical protein AAGE80_02550 [Pseudomonadota bacterium]
MKNVTIIVAAAALLSLGLLQACGPAVVYTVYKTEEERLAALEAWESEIQSFDCEQLAKASDDLEAEKDDLVDFDQRMDIVTDAQSDKNCQTG